MRTWRLIPALLAIILPHLVLHALMESFVAVNVTYPLGYNGSTSNILVLPASNYSIVSRGYGCGNPLPSSIVRIDSFDVVVWRDVEEYAPNQSQVYSVCSGGYGEWSDGFVAHTLIDLRTYCGGVYANQTGDNSGYGSTSLSFTVGSPWSIVYDIFYYVYVYVVYPPATLNVTICYDGSCVTRLYTLTDTINTISQSLDVWWNATRVDIYASVTGGYFSYVYLHAEVYYITPVYNQTSVTLGPADAFYVVYSGGPGYIAIGELNVSVEGLGTVASLAGMLAVNGTRVIAPAGRYLTLTAWCFGVNQTSMLEALVYYSNETVAEYQFIGSGSVNAPPSAAVINSNISLSLNLTQLARALNASSERMYTAVSLGAVGVSAGLYVAALWYMEPIYAMLGLVASVTGLLTAVYTGLPQQIVAVATFSTTAGALIMLLLLARSMVE